MRKQNVRKKKYDTVKRFFDIALSAPLLVAASPLMLITAVAVHAEDNGPVFYKQKRCTRGMREFDIIKFRSMSENNEMGHKAQLTKEGDSNITKVGKVLRRTRIDEIPQLVNILKGDMSIVGPRPERPELIKEIEKEVPHFRDRTKVRAGLTGYAQVKGGYYTPFDEKLAWDLEYIEKRSLLMDLKVILMTPLAVIRKP